MSRVYSGYNSKGWKPSGSSYYKHYRAWVEYWIASETDKQVVVQAYMGVNLDSSVSASFGAQMSATDYSAVTGSGSTVFNAGNTVTLIGTQSYTFNKGTSARTVGVTGYVWSSQGSWTGEWVGVTGYVTIPALQSWPVSYDANGGDTVPATQRKYLDVTLTLDSSTPTRTGYTFSKYNTAANGSGTNYNKGGSYTANEELYLYAQWTPNTYTVTYNKNASDATGSMSDSTFTYDTAGNLRSCGFTRTNYLFLGWATSPNGAVAYADGAQVTNLAASGSVELFAVWRFQYTRPDIQNLLAERYDSVAGQVNEFGTGARISAYVVPGIKETAVGTSGYVTTTLKAYYKASTSSTWIQIGSAKTISSPGNITPWVLANTTGSSDSMDGSQQYDVKVTAEVIESNVTKASTSAQTIVPIAEYLFDFDPVNSSVGVFTPASSNNKEFLIGEGGDIVLELDDNAASGVDYDLIQALTALGWI